MEAEGFAPRLLLVQSIGGVCAARTAALEPVRLLLSGPSGGSAACALLSTGTLHAIDRSATAIARTTARNALTKGWPRPQSHRKLQSLSKLSGNPQGCAVGGNK